MEDTRDMLAEALRLAACNMSDLKKLMPVAGPRGVVILKIPDSALMSGTAVLDINAVGYAFCDEASALAVENEAMTRAINTYDHAEEIVLVSFIEIGQTALFATTKLRRDGVSNVPVDSELTRRALPSTTAPDDDDDEDELCRVCRDPAKETKRCAKCMVARYCGPECQRAAWPKHRKVCTTKT